MVPRCHQGVRHNRVGRCRCHSSSFVTIVALAWPFSAPGLISHRTVFILWVDGICQIHRHQHTYHSRIKRVRKRRLRKRKRTNRMWKKNINKLMNSNSFVLVQNKWKPKNCKWWASVRVCVCVVADIVLVGQFEIERAENTTTTNILIPRSTYVEGYSIKQ